MKHSPLRGRWIVALLLWPLLAAATGSAAAQAQASPDARQPSAAGVWGVVRDGSGAGIPGATIVVREESGGLERVIEGGPDGTFHVARLAGGRYRVTLSAPGFAPVTEVVVFPESTSLEVTLAPAPVVEHVTVVSASRQEELRDSLNTRVDVIARSRIEETGGHETVGELLRELPGVVTRRGSETAGAAGEQIQGIDSRQVLVLIDGQPLAGARGIKRAACSISIANRRRGSSAWRSSRGPPLHCTAPRRSAA
jgi:hypothetical protein